jgi:hypothetical protein|tara:strand:+ start:1028 stop:1366 length:339 start_codon:yes stop_codon:yes gene_type:complete
MTFNIEEKDGKVFVFVEIPYKREFESSPITGARIRMTTEDVVARLAEEKVSHGNAIQEANLFNWRGDTRQGTWIFEKKTRKKVDKPAEKVILSKEKKTLPNKKSKAKKKTSK